MTTIKDFIKRHPVSTYYALVFAISWGTWLLFTGGAPMRSDPRFMFIVLAAPVAPSYCRTPDDRSHGRKGRLSRVARPPAPVARTSALVWGGTLDRLRSWR